MIIQEAMPYYGHQYYNQLRWLLHQQFASVPIFILILPKLIEEKGNKEHICPRNSIVVNSLQWLSTWKHKIIDSDQVQKTQTNAYKIFERNIFRNTITFRGLISFAKIVMTSLLCISESLKKVDVVQSRNLKLNQEPRSWSTNQHDSQSGYGNNTGRDFQERSQQ